MSLASILEQNKILVLQPNNRIKCTITGHEMPPNLNIVQAYLGSKRLEKARVWYNQDFSKYEPFIVEDKHNSKQLYCKVTRTMLNKIPEKVEKHINGAKYIRLKKLYLLAEEQKKKDKAQQAVKAQERDARLQAYLKRKAEEETQDEKADFWMPPEEDEEEGDDEPATSGDRIGSGEEEDEKEDEQGEEEGEEDDISSWVISSAKHTKRKAAQTISTDRPEDFKPSKVKRTRVSHVETDSTPTNKPVKQSVSLTGLSKKAKKKAATK